MPSFPRCLIHLQIHRERTGVFTGIRIGIVEVIDHLLDPHGIARWALILLQETPDIGIGSRVHIGGEGGAFVAWMNDVLEGVVLGGGVGLT